MRVVAIRLDPDQPAPADLIDSLMVDDYDEDECDHCGHDAADHDQRLGACDLCPCQVFVEPDEDEHACACGQVYCQGHDDDA